MSKKAARTVWVFWVCCRWCPPPDAARLPARTLGCSISRFPCRPTSRSCRKTSSGTTSATSGCPILGPITPGTPETALDPPSDDEVMRALEKARPIQGGLPLLYEIQRNNVRIVVEPIADYIDPPRVYPLVGPAQLHHAHYKCIVYFTEVTQVGWPIPYTTTDEDCQEVIYIDHDHLHMVGNVDPGPGSNY